MKCCSKLLHVFDNVKDLATQMIGISHETDEDVCAIVFYEDAAKLLKELLRFDETRAWLIELEDVENDCYDKEYFVNLGNDGAIAIEKAWHEKNEWHDAGYYSTDECFVLVHSSANSAILKSLGTNCQIHEFCFDGEQDECIECEELEVGEPVEAIG